MPFFHPMDRARPRGFTLIELLIVVAIISILAAIAVPNFLEAQTRAKVSRVKNDMRTLAFGVQAYRVDNNNPPVRRNSLGTPVFYPSMPETATRLAQMKALTTPVAYLSYLPPDIFDGTVPPPLNVIDYFDAVQSSWTVNAFKLVGFSKHIYTPEEVGWTLVSVGPDGYFGSYGDQYSLPSTKTPPELWATYLLAYDPTNGTVSSGNIYYNDDGGMDGAGAKLMEKMSAQ